MATLVSRKKIKLDRYAGQWLAFVDAKVIAHDKSLKEVMRVVDSRGLRDRASVLLVPRKDEGPYVLLF